MYLPFGFDSARFCMLKVGPKLEQLLTWPNEPSLANCHSCDSVVIPRMTLEW